MSRIARAVSASLAPGALPLQPFPWVMVFRWGLVPLFVLYIATGQTRGPAWATMAMVALLVGYFALNHVRFTRATTRDTLLRVWATTLPTDVVFLAVGTGLDNHEVAPTAILAVALLAQGAAMFRPGAIVTLALAFGLAVIAADTVIDAAADDIAAEGSVWTAIIVLLSAAFLAALSRQLSAARTEANDRAQAARDALTAAEAANEQFAALVRHSPAMVMLFDERGYPTFVNENIIESSGVPELLAQPERWVDLIVPDDFVAVRSAIGAALRGVTQQFEFRAIDRHGEIHVMEAVMFAVGAGAAAIGLDMTAERRAREEANATQEQLASLLENLPVRVYQFDKQGNMVSANSSVVLARGRSAAELSWEFWRPTFESEVDFTRVVEAVLTATGNGEGSTVRFRSRDYQGSLRDFQGIVYPTTGGAGAVVIDLTEENAMRDQMARLSQMETLGTLAGGIAHDFNNLLTAIMGNIYLAERTVPDGHAAREYLRGAAEAGDAGAKLVRDLLDYSRPRPDAFDELHIRDVVDTTVRLGRAALGRRIGVEVQPFVEDPVIHGQAGPLGQVLLNLLVNARDAMPEGGAITLSCHRSSGLRRPESGERGDFWVLSVQDDGLGMAQEVAARVFDPFFTTKEPGKGTGLGLATCAMVMKNHGGCIAVDSKPGAGATFRLYFPVHTPAAVTTSEREASAHRADQTASG